MRDEVRLSQGLAVLELNVMAAGTKKGKNISKDLEDSWKYTFTVVKEDFIKR